MIVAASPPPLMTVNVEIPDWPALSTARRRLDAVRSCAGHVATGLGAIAAAVGLFTADFAGASLMSTAALSVGGLTTLRLWRPDGHQKAVATVLYLTPGAGLAALLIGERIVPGIHWGEALALTAWTAATMVLRPARVARRMMSPAPAPAPASVPAVVEEADDHPAAAWWAQHVAVDGGTAPGTLLEDVERTGERAMRAVIRSAVPGRPVPDVSIRNLSALMDVPEDEISVNPVPGRGASVRLLTVGKPDQEHEDAATVWAQRIAPTAMPGAVLTAVRVGRPGTTTTAKETTR
jgi:hypothetical protein